MQYAGFVDWASLGGKVTANVFALLLLVLGCCSVAASILRVLRAESSRLGKISDGARSGI